MFAEFGQAPICLELDLDSYDGPWQHVARFRRGSGWLMVAECTIQSEHDILTARLVTACDEHEHPVPAFQAMHLTECDWINPTYCDEVPPDILDDLICEEEGALIARWHREKNSALAEAFEAQETRIAELEGRVQSMVARNEAQIAELRQRRRHPDATAEMRMTMGQVIRDIDAENDELMAEMTETRAAIRAQSAESEERLWAREDLLVEVTPLHIVRWTARTRAHSDIPARPRQYATQFLPASGRTGGATPTAENMAGEIAAGLERTAAKKAAQVETSAEHKGDLPKHSPALRRISAPPREKKVKEAAPDADSWTFKREELLKSLWRDGQSPSTIAKALGSVSRDAVIDKARQMGLGKYRAAKLAALQPILLPTALRNMQMERDRARRSLTALEVRGRKFFEGSRKYTRNREQRAELEQTIAALDRKIDKAEQGLKESA